MTTLNIFKVSKVARIPKFFKSLNTYLRGLEELRILPVLDVPRDLENPEHLLQGGMAWRGSPSDAFRDRTRAFHKSKDALTLVMHFCNAMPSF